MDFDYHPEKVKVSANKRGELVDFYLVFLNKLWAY